MIEFLRWFFGWSEFKIEGDSDYFLNIFKKNIWMVRKQGKFIISRCLTKDYKYLFDKSPYYSCYITKYKDRGFLNFLKKYRFRYGIISGIFLFLIFLFVSNIFVWDIKVNGNRLIQDEDILKVCEKNGLYFGSFMGNIDEKDIEFRLKEKFPQISWVSLNRVAGKYNIEINESIKKPKIKDYVGPCNVIATEDGEIIYVEAYAGTPIIRPGDFVKKGQVLISTIQKLKDRENEVIFSNADAKIIAKVNLKKQFTCKKNTVVDQKTGTKKYEKELCFFGLNIPLKLVANKKKIVKSKETYNQVNFFGLRLPALIKTTEYDIYEKVNLKEDFRKIKRILAKNEKDWELEELKGTTILNRICNFIEFEDEVILDVNLVVEKRIDEKAAVNEEEIEEILKKDEEENQQ